MAPLPHRKATHVGLSFCWDGEPICHEKNEIVTVVNNILALPQDERPGVFQHQISVGGLAELSADDKAEAFRYFCSGCGSEDPGCRCMSVM